MHVAREILFRALVGTFLSYNSIYVTLQEHAGKGEICSILSANHDRINIVMKAVDLVAITPKSEVYIDMDGVLADFDTLVAQELGITKSDPKTHLPSDTFDALIGTDFFSRIPVFDTANALIDLVLQYVPHYNICSAPLKSDMANSEAHKRIWIKNHLKVQPKSMVFTRHKGAMVGAQADGTPNILIDDFSKNIHEWKLAGGLPIHYNASVDSLDLVKNALDNAYGKNE
jgi:hypothetical protein